MGWGTKVCSNGPGHMTKVAAMPVYGKPLKIFFSRTKRPMTLKLGMQHWVLEYYQVCSNDGPGWVDLDLFCGKVKFGSLCFCMGKKVKQWIFSGTIIVYDIKLVDTVN